MFWGKLKLMELPIKEIGSEIGLALVVIYLLVKEFLSSKKSEEQGEQGGVRQRIEEWHAKQTLESAITKLSENMVRQTDILERLELDHRDTLKLVSKIDSRLQEKPACAQFRPNL